MTSTEAIPQVAIFSFENDLHALAVEMELRDRSAARCYIVETPFLSQTGGLVWSQDDRSRAECRLRARSGEWFDPRKLDAIWWRRINQPQVFRAAEERSELEANLISRAWQSSIVGLLKCEFSGTWISDPDLTRQAENKMVQLQAARRAGLKTPKTLISQDPTAVRSFCKDMGGTIVVKAVAGARRRALVTAIVGLGDLQDDASIQICPSIFQEVIPGDRHLRVHCFGSDIRAVLIESQELDWRRDLNVPFRSYDVDQTLQERVKHVLNLLGIRMGIMDLKLRPNGEVVWLEVNPQGQFLFAEGLSGADLLNPFVDFLLRESSAGRPEIRDRERASD